MKTRYLRPALFGALFGLPQIASADLQLISLWNFDAGSVSGLSIDVQAGVPGQIRSGASISAAGEGRTGTGSDRAIVLGTGQQNFYVADASFFNAAAATDTVSVSFWQKLTTITSPFTVFITSPSSTAGGRGFSGHVPWSDGNIYFDTAGCCDPPQRVAGAPVDGMGGPVTWVDTWVHVALIKNGINKEVYVNGILGPAGTDAAALPTDFTDMFIGNGPGSGNVVNGSIDDFAIFSGALDATQVAALAGGASPSSLVGSNDTDADGLPDAYEYRFFPGDLTKMTAAGDNDSDGFSNATEFANGTNPTLGDSDGDGLPDSSETNTGIWVSATNTGTSPSNPDTDGDALNDGLETNTGTFVSAANPGTNPLIADTDADGFNDGVEVLYGGTNPLSGSSRPLRPSQLDLLAYFPFNDATDPAKTTDVVHGYVGELLVGTDLTPTSYTPDAEGHTGVAGDKAMDFGMNGNNWTGVSVEAGEFLNIASSQNQIAFSFWQKLYAVTDSTAFKGISPISSGGSRGASGHATWSNNRFYFDTAGCCDGTQRIDEDKNVNGELELVGEWHHLVFQKNGDTKEIWVDGVLLKTGTNTAPLPTDFASLQIGRNESNENTAGIIDDFAVYADALTPAEIQLIFTGTPPNSPTLVPPNTDADGDGMPDGYETANGLNPAVNDAAGDLDSDGKTNIDEYNAGTLPNNPDTDGDTLKDGVESKTGTWVSATNTGTDPLKADTDGDGLGDAVETNTGTFVSASNTGTDPNKADTDGDAWKDGVEIAYGSNPFLASSVPSLGVVWWSFNDATNPIQSADVVHQFKVDLLNGAAFSDDALGRTSQAGDRALNLGTTKELQMAQSAEAQWLNISTGADSVAFSFWQILDSVSDSSAFWASATSSGGERGAQGHATWSNNRFYFDTAGCCDPPQRIDEDKDVNGPVDLVGSWHHLVFQKDGGTKQIWVDGVLLKEGTGAAPLPADFYKFTIGADATGNGNTLGMIDDMAVYDDALTPDQIARLAAGESPTAILAPAAALAFTSITYNPTLNQIVLTWTSSANTTYRLDSSETLATWPIEINDSIQSTGATTSYTVNLTAGSPAANYYRVKQN